MFNEEYDPMARLEATEINIASLHSDKMEMPKALNHQANDLNLMNEQMRVIIEHIKRLDSEIQMLQLRLSNLQIRETR